MLHMKPLCGVGRLISVNIPKGVIVWRPTETPTTWRMLGRSVKWTLRLNQEP